MVDSPDEIRRTDTSHHVDSSVVRREASRRGVLVCVFGYRVFPQNVLSHPAAAAGSLPTRCAQKRAFSSKSPLAPSCRRLLPAYPFGSVSDLQRPWMTRDSVNGITLSKTRIARPARLSTFRGNRFAALAREQVYNWSNRGNLPRLPTTTVHDLFAATLSSPKNPILAVSHRDRRSLRLTMRPEVKCGRTAAPSRRQRAPRNFFSRFIVVVRFCCC